MKINWINIKTSLKFIFAIIIVSVLAYFGIQHEERVDLGECGYATVEYQMITIHSDCYISVKSAVIPTIGIEKNNVALAIPKGWHWRIQP